MSWMLAVEAGLMIADFIYHRWPDDHLPKPQPARELTIPRVDDGADYPRIYGRCRVMAPVISWCDTPLFGSLPENVTPSSKYFLSMLMTLGIPFEDGQSSLLGMWSGDTPAIQRVAIGGTHTICKLSDLVGDGSDYAQREATVQFGTIGPVSAWPPAAFGAVEFLNGNSSQMLVTGGVATSHAGDHMISSGVGNGGDTWSAYYGNIAPGDVPGWRGFLSAFLYLDCDGTNGVYGSNGATVRHWCVGPAPAVAQYSFEVQSLPSTFLGPNRQVSVSDGDITRQSGDANPVDVCWDLLFGTKGKLGLDSSMMDAASWQAAAATLDAEGNGYSRSIESGVPVNAILADIFGQIDGGIIQDPTTGKLLFRLVRADYDPSAVLNINKTNCTKLTNVAAGSNTDVPNSVRVSCRNRGRNYADDSGVAHDDANAIAQGGEFVEIGLRCEGVAEVATGNNIAARELAARGRTFIKCTATVDRLTFLNVLPLDVLTLTYDEPPLSMLPMRVAAVRRGPPGSSQIELDLIQDYYYSWRNLPPSSITGQPLKLPGGTFGR